MTTPEVLTYLRTYLSGEDPVVTGPGHWELYAQDYALAQEAPGTPSA